MSLFKRPGGTIWWIYLTHNGQKVRRTTGTTDKKAAQRQHDELRAELWQHRPDQGHRLADALKLWLTAAERSDSERYQIKRFLKDYPDRNLSAVTSGDLNSLLSDYSVASANRIGNIVRAALNLAAANGWCDKPTILRRKGAKKRLRWLTADEWDRLYVSLPDHLKAPALFAVATGLRQSNVLGLRWAQINEAKKSMWVDQADTKAGKSLTIPLSARAMQALAIAKQTRSATDPHVFLYHGKPMSKIKTGWITALEQAQLGTRRTWTDDAGKAHQEWDCEVTWHTLRHTWASWHVQAGTPLSVLKELGGWASMDMVMVYAHLAQSHVAAWANNAEVKLKLEVA